MAASSGGGAQSGQVCRFWSSMGKCYRANNCNFLHIGPGAPAEAPAESKSQRLCKNLLTNGFCKTENQGCEFSHDRKLLDATLAANAEASGAGNAPVVTKPTARGASAIRIVDPSAKSPATAANTSTPRGGLTPTSTAFVPGKEFVPGKPFVPGTKEFVPGAKEFVPGAKEFVPAGSASGSNSGASTPSSFLSPNPSAPEFVPGGAGAAGAGGFGTAAGTRSSGFAVDAPEFTPTGAIFQAPLEPEEDVATTMTNTAGMPYPPLIDTIDGMTYFMPHSAAGPKLVPVQLNNYVAPLPSIAHCKPSPRYVPHFMVDENIRQELVRRNAMLLAHTEAEDPHFKNVPRMVLRYHTFYPLEDPNATRNNVFFGYPSWVFKATNMDDGLTYCLRRVEGFRLTNTYATGIVDLWKNQRHPNLVQLHEAFTTKEFGDSSIVFVHDYHPGAMTAVAAHLTPPSPNLPIPPVQERTIWSYICQLTSALHTLHAAGLVSRAVDASKILVTGKNRVRIGCTGIFDLLTFESGASVPHLQHEDILSLGKFVLALTCAPFWQTALQNFPRAIEYIASHYSTALKNFVLFLLAPAAGQRPPTMDDIVVYVAPRMMSEMEHAESAVDIYEAELSKELENGRLFRLLVKLGFINERPEYDLDDPNWSENEDRYLLKLFRDYVFHQVTDDGSPSVDYGHVVETLNKLDVGTEEKVLLSSRNEQSLLIVRFADLKRCINNSFNELLAKQRRPPVGLHLEPGARHHSSK